MPKIGEVRNQNSESTGRNIKEYSKQFYQTMEWRELRERYRQKKRLEHEQIITEVFENNPEKNDPNVLLEFIYDPRKNPLSELSLGQGIIKVADVCDHIRPRLQGGGDTEDNLQWLTEEEHKIKTLREQRREHK